MNSEIKLGGSVTISLFVCLFWTLFPISNAIGSSLEQIPKDFNVSVRDTHTTKNSDKVSAQNIEENTRKDIELYVLKWTNQERQRRRLPILKINPTLGKLAQIHSRNQATSGVMAHDSDNFPKGWRTFEERMKKLKFVPPMVFGENVFWSSANLPSKATERNDYARKMVHAWMTSEKHRKNILHPNFSRMGIGILDGYVTQLFASRDPSE